MGGREPAATGGSAGAAEPHDNDPACGDVGVVDAVDHEVVDTVGQLLCDQSGVDVDSCSGEGDIVGFRYQDEQVDLYLVFEPDLVTAPITDQRLREKFKWLWYDITPPNQASTQPVTTGPIVISGLDNVEQFAYADGRLHLKLQTTVERVERWVAPEGDCYDSDIGPDVCRCLYPINLPVTEDLDLILR